MKKESLQFGGVYVRSINIKYKKIAFAAVVILWVACIAAIASLFTK
jgi:hypothetical protein